LVPELLPGSGLARVDPNSFTAAPGGLGLRIPVACSDPDGEAAGEERRRDAGAKKAAPQRLGALERLGLIVAHLDEIYRPVAISVDALDPRGPVGEPKRVAGWA